MRQTQKLKDAHFRFVKEFDAVWDQERPERQQALNDRRFPVVSGAMWEGDLGTHFENKPKVEVNKLLLACTRIENEYKNNRIDVDFIAKDGAKNPAMADKCDSLYRADRQDSGSREASDNAFIEMLYGGMGAWRLTTTYEDEGDEDNERQRIVFKPIYDADQTVFFSRDGRSRTKADASMCFLLTPMTPEAFKDEWGKDPVDMRKDVEERQFDWITPDTVYVAEVYEIEKVKRLVDTWKHPVSEEEKKIYEEDYEEDPELRQMMEDTGWQLVKSRRLQEKRVHKYIIDGQEVLEDCGLIAGCEHPVIPVYARRWVIDGIERFQGHVRAAKDPMRIKNVQFSQLVFQAAVSPMEIPILLSEQVAGHEDRWANLHKDNAPFVTINAIRNDNTGQLEAAAPVAYTKPPTLSPAMAALLQIAEADLSDILGKPNEGEKMEANQSGKAVELVQKQIGMLAFVYFEAMATAFEQAGRVWLSMAKDVYVEEGRKLKGYTKDGAAEQVELMKPIMIDGKAEVENDFSRVDLDVSVSVGPSSDSKRAAGVKAKTNLALITSDEETKQIITLSALRDIEDENTSDLSEWARRQLVGKGVIEPTEEDKKRMEEAAQNQQPDPNAEYLKAEAEKSRALTKKAGADTVLALNKAAETEVNMLKTITEVDMAAAQAQQAQMNPPAVGESGPAPQQAEQGMMNATQTPATPAQL